MTNCPLCGSGNAITLFTSTQCVSKPCSNYNASWESEILDTSDFKHYRINHSRLFADKKNGSMKNRVGN